MMVAWQGRIREGLVRQRRHRSRDARGQRDLASNREKHDRIPAGDVVRHQLDGARDAAHRASGDLFRRDVGLLSQLRAPG